MSHRGVKAQREQQWRRDQYADGRRDALAGRPASQADRHYQRGYKVGEAARPAVADGEKRIDPLVRIGVLVRQTFGDTEGDEILIESLRRLPRPQWPLAEDGAYESDYLEAVRLTIIDRHPEVAHLYRPLDDIVDRLVRVDGMPVSAADSGS